MTGTSNVHELQKRVAELQGSEKILDIFSKVVSGGKPGYKTVIEKKKVILKCEGCGGLLEGHERFCPNCGKKAKKSKEDNADTEEKQGQTQKPKKD